METAGDSSKSIDVADGEEEVTRAKTSVFICDDLGNVGISPSVSVSATTCEEDIQGGGDRNNNTEYIALKDEANILAKSGRLEESLKKYTQAESKATTDMEYAVIHHNKGIVYEALEKFAVALERYESAIRLCPNYYKAWKRKAKMLNKLECYEEAQACMINVFFRERRDKMGPQEDTQAIWRNIIHNIGVIEALDITVKDEPIIPTDSDIEAFLRTFFCDPVSILWKKKPKTSLNNENSQGYLAAVNALQNKRYDMVISNCDFELNQPNSNYKEDTHMLRGTFRFISGCGKSAISDFNAVMASEDLRVSHKTKSSAAVKCGLCIHYSTIDDQQSLAMLSMAKDYWQMNSDLYYQIAMISEEDHNDYAGACGILPMAVECCPVTETTHFYSTKLHEALFMRNLRNATEINANPAVLRTMAAAANDFDLPDCYYSYYKVLMKAGSTKHAKEVLNKAISMDPKNVKYLLAQLMDDQCDMTPAVVKRMLDDLREIDRKCGGTHSVISYHIGCLELLLGNKEVGWKSFNESINNCRSIFSIVERVVTKLDWEMNEKLDEMLNEQTTKYSVDPQLFSRRIMFDSYHQSHRHRPNGPVCCQCGQRQTESEAVSSDDTDEEEIPDLITK